MAIIFILGKVKMYLSRDMNVGSDKNNTMCNAIFQFEINRNISRSYQYQML